MTTNLALSEAVRVAVAQLEQAFDVAVEGLESAGAVVTVRHLEIGQRWDPSAIDLAFEVPFNYPFAAIYPYYTLAILTRTDGGQLPAALQRVSWRGDDWTQVSLRANRWDPQVDTAIGAVLQVQTWFRAA